MKGMQSVSGGKILPRPRQCKIPQMSWFISSTRWRGRWSAHGWRAHRGVGATWTVHGSCHARSEASAEPRKLHGKNNSINMIFKRTSSSRGPILAEPSKWKEPGYVIRKYPRVMPMRNASSTTGSNTTGILRSNRTVL